MNFAERHPLVSVFLFIGLLRKGPQDIPASQFLFAILLVFSFMLGAASFMIEYEVGQALLRTIADMVISLGLVYVLLQLAGRKARILQTLTALLGVSVILNSLSWPLLFLLHDTESSAVVIAAFLYLIFIWNITVTGHIFGQTLAVSFSTGLLFAVAYSLIAVFIFYSLFPIQ